MQVSEATVLGEVLERIGHQQALLVEQFGKFLETLDAIHAASQVPSPRLRRDDGTFASKLEQELDELEAYERRARGGRARARGAIRSADGRFSKPAARSF